MKQILLCTDGSVFAQSSYYYGAWFAQRLDAAIDVLHVTDVRGQARAESANFSGSIGIDASDMLLKQLVDLEHQKAKLSHQQAKLILQAAEVALQEQGATNFKTMHRMGFLVDLLPELEAAADLVILGKRGEAAEFASGHLGANLERIIRSSRKPCLVTSRQMKPIEQVLLAYDGSRISKKMLAFVLTSPAFKALTIHMLYVAKESGDTATGQNRLEEAQQQAQDAGFDIVSEVVVGNPESEIANYAEAHAFDLLVMGAYGHNRIRHLVIGSVTAQILRSSHIPVLVLR